VPTHAGPPHPPHPPHPPRRIPSRIASGAHPARAHPRGRFKGEGLFPFVVCVWLVQLLWLARYAEQALFARAEAARRHASRHLVDSGAVLLGWWLAALVLTSSSGSLSFDPGDRTAIVLLLAGAFWPDLRTLWRMQRRLWVPGEHWPPSKVGLAVNATFMLHRYAEFMFLMLGEALLQLIIQDIPHDLVVSVPYYTIEVIGYGLAVCAMYSFHVTEPHDASSHVLLRAGRTALLYELLFCLKAAAVRATPAARSCPMRPTPCHAMPRGSPFAGV
jgi:hypothetical protein